MTSTPFTDRPIKGAAEDEFGRELFAKSLAGALSAATLGGGLVVALEGEWGSGKTSVLNMVQMSLEQMEPLPLVIRFDPWLISGSESLIESFLVQLAAELGQTPKCEQASKVANRLLRFAKLLTPVKLIPGVEPWGSLVQKAVEVTEKATEGVSSALGALGDLDLQKRKNGVADALKELGRPVIVMIDDVDRLEPGEIRQIFQLVKAVADFEGISYLLAYDAYPVYQALSFDGIYDGPSYAEKIVQISYPLPPPGYWPLKRFLRRKLDNFVQSNNIMLSDFEARRIEEALSGIGRLTHAVRHPRDVLRLLNRLQVSALPTRGEVNFADLVAFELLGLRFPNIVRTIRRRTYEFIKQTQPRHDEPMVLDYLDRVNPSREPREISNWKIQLWEKLSEEDRKVLFNLLGFLFPGFRNEPHMVERDPVQELRLNQRDPLHKLLAYGPVEGMFSAADARNFLERHEHREDFLAELVDSQTILGWFPHVETFIAESVDSPLELLKLMPDLAYRVVDKLDAEMAMGVVAEIARFARCIIRLLPESSRRDAFFALARNDQSLHLSESIVLIAVKEHGKWVHQEPGSVIPEEQRFLRDWMEVSQGRDLWLTQVRSKSEDHSKLLAEVNPLSVLFRWGQLMEGDFAEVHTFTDKLIETPTGLKSFLALFRPNMGLSGLELLVSDWARFRELCVSPSTLARNDPPVLG